MRARQLIAIGFLLLVGAILVWQAFVRSTIRDHFAQLSSLIEAGEEREELEVLFRSPPPKGFLALKTLKAGKLNMEKIIDAIPIYAQLLKGDGDPSKKEILQKLADSNTRLIKALNEIADKNRLAFIFRSGRRLTPEMFEDKFKDFQDVTDLIIQKM